MNADCKREWRAGDEGYIIVAPVQMFPFRIEPVVVEQVINPIYGVVNVRVKAMGAGAYRDYLIELEWADDVREHIFDER